MYFLLKNGDIPACYVRLPEGIPFFFGGGELFAALFKAKITRFTPPEDNAWEKAEHVFPLSFFFLRLVCLWIIIILNYIVCIFFSELDGYILEMNLYSYLISRNVTYWYLSYISPKSPTFLGGSRDMRPLQLRSDVRWGPGAVCKWWKGCESETTWKFCWYPFWDGKHDPFKGKVTSNWGIKRSRIESPGSGFFLFSRLKFC